MNLCFHDCCVCEENVNSKNCKFKKINDIFSQLDYSQIPRKKKFYDLWMGLVILMRLISLRIW